MARRHDRSVDGKETLIGRRTLLKLTGAAVVAGGASAAAGTASAATVDLGAEGLSPGDDLSPYLDEYWRSGNEVHVPGGEYELSNPSSLSISADQDALLVGDGDVVADHGYDTDSINVVAQGAARVRVQNITLRGKSGGGSKIRVYATSDDAVAEMVNFNRPDGTNDGDEATGFFVPTAHEGTTRFINCHIEGFSDNGIYASSAAKDGNGPVEVYGGLYKNNDTAGVRLGSSGSKAYHVVVVNDEHAPGVSGGNNQRGIRVREPGPIEIVDCDVTHFDVNGATGPIDVEDESWQTNLDGNTWIENVRIRNETGVPAIDTEGSSYEVSGDTIHLSGSGNLDLEGSGPYANVLTGSDAAAPTTEKRWVDPDTLQPVDGTGGTSAGGSTGNDDDDADGGLSGSRVEVIAASGGPLFTYGFVADGPVAKVTDAGSNSAESNDSIADGSDGTTEVTGQVGNGFGDTYDAEGDLLSFTADTDPENYTLRVDGEAVDPSTIGEEPDDGETTQSEVEVIAADGGPAFGYTLLVTGTVAKVTDAGSDSAEGNDEIVENGDGTAVVEGRVGNGFGDTFRVEGSIDGFETDTDPANYTLLVDGEAVDPADLGGSAPEPLPNRISFDAADGDSGTYAFEVSGEVRPEPDGGALEDADVISGSAVSGEVSGDVDAFRFSGDVVSLELQGAATVTIEDNE